MPAQKREEFRQLLICADNPGLESEQRLMRLDVLTTCHSSTSEIVGMIFHLSVDK